MDGQLGEEDGGAHLWPTDLLGLHHTPGGDGEIHTHVKSKYHTNKSHRPCDMLP